MANMAARLAQVRVWGAGFAAVLLVLALAGIAFVKSDAGRRWFGSRAQAIVESKLPGARLGPGFDVTWRGRAVFAPVEIQAPDGGEVIRIDRLEVRPRFRGLLIGKLQPASLILDGVQIDAGERFEKLLALRGGSPAAPAAGGTAAPEDRGLHLELRRVSLQASTDDRRLVWKPFDVRIWVERGLKTRAS